MIVYLKLLVLFVRIVDLIIYQSINFIEFERIQSNMNHIIIHLCFFFVIFIFHKVNINYGFLGNLKNTKCFQPACQIGSCLLIQELEQNALYPGFSQQFKQFQKCEEIFRC